MPQAELTTRLKVLATAGVMLALLLAALDQTIVGTALPRIVAELNGLDRYSWLITGYLVASTVVVPIAGHLGDLFGRKPFIIVGMIGFVAASALCGLSQDMNQLIVLRIVQGLFGGTLFASAFTVLGDIYTPAERARIQGLFGAVFGLSSIVGPVVGGFLTDNLGWRWVFYVNLPVGLLGVLVVAAFLPFVRTRASWRDIDFVGSATLAAGLIPMLIALSVAKDQGWNSFEVLGLLAFGAAMLIAFFMIEQRVKEPIVPFTLFKNRAFAVSVLVGFFAALGMFGMIIFVPLETQGVLGVSVTNSGLLLTPMMLGLIVSSILAQRLPGAISAQIAKVNLPPAFKNVMGSSASNPNALLDPARIAAAKAKLPAPLAPLFDQAMHAVRQALALTLHDVFLISVILTAGALVISLFMPDVPLRSRKPQPQASSEEVPTAAVG